MDLKDIKWNITPRLEEDADKLNETSVTEYLNDFINNNISRVYVESQELDYDASSENGWGDVIVDLDPFGFPADGTLEVENGTLIFDGNFSGEEDISSGDLELDLSCYNNETNSAFSIYIKVPASSVNSYHTSEDPYNSGEHTSYEIEKNFN